MPLLTKVGSFTKRVGTGTQAITGLGFTPKAIVFWTTGSNDPSGTWSPHIASSLGFTAGATNSFAVATTSLDANAQAETARRMAAKAVTFVNVPGATVAECDLASFDADGFTLNWTTNTADAVYDNMHINFLALGGSDLTGARVVNWLTPTAVGNKAVTGAGFSPDLVLHGATFNGTSTVPVSAAHSSMSFGAMNKHGQQWANGHISQDAVSPSNTARFQQTDAALALPVWDGVGQFFQAHFVSMDADGFTTNFATTQPSAESVMSLCLKGVSSKIGAFAKTTAAAPATQSVTRVGLMPKAVLFTSAGNNAAGAPTTHAVWQTGAADGTNQRVAYLVDYDAQNPTNAKSVFRSGAFHQSGDSTATTAVGTVTSFDADGFSLTYNPNEATSYESLYLALGDAGVNTYPSAVF